MKNGNIPVTNVTLDDALAGVTVLGGPIAQMDAGDTDTTTFTASYVITPADVTAGQVANGATVRGTAANGTNLSDVWDESDFTDDDWTITYIANAPAIGLVKTVSSITDVNSNGMNDAGDIISYAFNVVNMGNVALTNVRVDDANATIAQQPRSQHCPSVPRTAPPSRASTSSPPMT